MSEESREYYEEYVAPGNIFARGPINVTWDSANFIGLNWDWIFEGLWRVESGAEMIDPASVYYVKAPDSMSFDRAVFPAVVVENTLQKYFNVSKQGNADGSLTLWIDFVALTFGKELSAQSVLTVMPEEDGAFKYLSNVYTTY